MRPVSLSILFVSLVLSGTARAQRAESPERTPLAIDFRGAIAKIAYCQVTPGKASKVVPMSAYRDKASGAITFRVVAESNSSGFELPKTLGEKNIVVKFAPFSQQKTLTNYLLEAGDRYKADMLNEVARKKGVKLKTPDVTPELIPNIEVTAKNSGKMLEYLPPSGQRYGGLFEVVVSTPK